MDRYFSLFTANTIYMTLAAKLQSPIDTCCYIGPVVDLNDMNKEDQRTSASLKARNVR